MPMFRRPASTNRFGVDLLPGHPRFSVIEDQLSAGTGDDDFGACVGKSNRGHFAYAGYFGAEGTEENNGIRPSTRVG
jgi:hypothetical protein